MASTVGKKAAAKKSLTAARKAPSTPKEVSFQSRLSSFLSSVRANRDSSVSGAGRTRRKYLLPVIGLVVLLGLAYIASRYLVVAWVDRKPITRLAYYAQLDKKYGHDLREQLIVQSLIDSEASQQHVSASDEEISEEIKKIETEQGGTANLDQVLQQQGISRDELKNLVRLQLLRQKMFGSQATITEAEVNQYLAENKDSLPPSDPKDASAQAKLVDSVRQQLLQQKINATFSSWLQENLNSDRVLRL